MNIVDALHSEESKLERQLAAVRVLLLLNGGVTAAVAPRHKSSTNGRGGKRTLSAAGRANIVRAVKARWARIKAEKAKKAKRAQ